MELLNSSKLFSLHKSKTYFVPKYLFPKLQIPNGKPDSTKPFFRIY